MRAQLQKKETLWTLFFFVIIAFWGASYSFSVEGSKGKKVNKEHCLYQEVSLLAPDKSKKVSFKTEVAYTPHQKEQGLMFRKFLPTNEGMLFLWSKPQQLYMWMRNTYIPLDMLFIHENKVVGLIEATQTQSDAILTVPVYANKVLEVNYGLSKKHGIGPGWQFELKESCLE